MISILHEEARSSITCAKPHSFKVVELGLRHSKVNKVKSDRKINYTQTVSFITFEHWRQCVWASY